MPPKTTTPKRSGAGELDTPRPSLDGEDAPKSPLASARGTRISKTPLAIRFRNVILKKWSITSLDDILPPELQPPSWTEHILMCLATIAKRESLSSARRALKIQIRDRKLEEWTQSETVMTVRGYLTERDVDDVVRGYKNNTSSSSSREASAQSRNGTPAADARDETHGVDRHNGTEDAASGAGTDDDAVAEEIVVGLGSEASDSGDETSRAKSANPSRNGKPAKRGNVAGQQGPKPVSDRSVTSGASPSIDLASLSAVKNRVASARRPTGSTPTPASRNKQRALSQPVSAQKARSAPGRTNGEAADQQADQASTPPYQPQLRQGQPVPSPSRAKEGQLSKSTDKAGVAPSTAGAPPSQKAAQPAVKSPRRSAVNPSSSVDSVAAPRHSPAKKTTTPATAPPTQAPKQNPVPLSDPDKASNPTPGQTHQVSGTPVTITSVHTPRQTAPAANVSKYRPAPSSSLPKQAAQAATSPADVGRARVASSVPQNVKAVQERGPTVASTSSGLPPSSLQPSPHKTGPPGAVAAAYMRATTTQPSLAGSVRTPAADPAQRHLHSAASPQAPSQNNPARPTTAAIPSSSSHRETSISSPERGSKSGLPATRRMPLDTQPSPRPKDKAIAPTVFPLSRSAGATYAPTTGNSAGLGSRQPAGQMAISPTPGSQQSTTQQPAARRLTASQPATSSQMLADQTSASQKPVSYQPVSQKTSAPRSGPQQPASQQPVPHQPGSHEPVRQPSLTQVPVSQLVHSRKGVKQESVSQQPIIQQPAAQGRVSQSAAPQQVVPQQPITQKTPATQPLPTASQQPAVQHGEGARSASPQRRAPGTESLTPRASPARTSTSAATPTGGSLKRKQPTPLIMQIMAAEREKTIAEAQLNYVRMSIQHERSGIAELRANLERLSRTEPGVARQIEAAEYLQGFADRFGDVIGPKPDAGEAAVQAADGGGGQGQGQDPVGTDIQPWWNWAAYAVTHIKNLLRADGLAAARAEAREELNDAEERLRSAEEDERIWAERLAEQMRELAVLRSEQEVENARKRQRML